VPFYKKNGDHEFFGTHIYFSWNYIADFIFSFLVAINIFSFFGMSKLFLKFLESNIFKSFHSVVSTISNCKFTLYLFHVPLLFFISSMFHYDNKNELHQLGLILAVIISVYFIAQKTEWKVIFWRNKIEILASLINKKSSRFIYLFRNN
jgi:hypothetical protein